MDPFIRCALPVALVLAIPGTAMAQHGRPPMVYEVVSISAKDLQIFQGQYESEARDVNNKGEIVGWATTSTGHKHAFKRALLGSTIDLGSAYPTHNTYAEGINDSAEVVGYMEGGERTRAFYWSSGAGWVNLSNVNPPGVEDARDYVAAAINSQGRIVGWALEDHVGYDCDAVTWWHHAATPSLIYTPPGDFANWANDISDSSWFAGDEHNPSNSATWGFRYRAGTLEYPPEASAGTYAETVRAVNEAGTVVGGAWFPGGSGQRAIRWRRNGNPLVLGLLPGADNSEAFDINETEFVVGSVTRSVPSGGWRERAFLFHYEFGMVELPAPVLFGGPVLANCHANRLNDRKANGLIQVAGHCMRGDKKQAVRWDVFVSEHPQ